MHPLLEAAVGGPALEFGEQPGLRQTPGQKVTGSKEPDLARLHQRGEGRKGFLQWRVAIVAVRVVEVDRVHAETPEAFVAFRDDLVRPESGLGTRVAEPDFGGEEQTLAVAALADPAADERLTVPRLAALVPRRVNVRGVEEPSSGLPVSVHDLDRRVVGVPAPRVHRTQAAATDPDSGRSKGKRLHGQIPYHKPAPRCRK